jgi:thymidylate kinase
MAFHGRVRAAYLARAAQFPQRIRVLDGSLGVAAVAAQVAGLVAAL